YFWPSWDLPRAWCRPRPHHGRQVPVREAACLRDATGVGELPTGRRWGPGGRRGGRAALAGSRSEPRHTPVVLLVPGEAWAWLGAIDGDGSKVFARPASRLPVLVNQSVNSRSPRSLTSPDPTSSSSKSLVGRRGTRYLSPGTRVARNRPWGSVFAN